MPRFKPETIGHASRLSGLTPTAVLAVLRYIKRQQKRESVSESYVIKKAVS